MYAADTRNTLRRLSSENSELANIIPLRRLGCFNVLSGS